LQLSTGPHKTDEFLALLLNRFLYFWFPSPSMCSCMWCINLNGWIVSCKPPSAANKSITTNCFPDIRPLFGLWSTSHQSSGSHWQSPLTGLPVWPLDCPNGSFQKCELNKDKLSHIHVCTWRVEGGGTWAFPP